VQPGIEWDTSLPGKPEMSLVAPQHKAASSFALANPFGKQDILLKCYEKVRGRGYKFGWKSSQVAEPPLPRVGVGLHHWPGWLPVRVEFSTAPPPGSRDSVPPGPDTALGSSDEEWRRWPQHLLGGVVLSPQTGKQ